MKILHLKYKMHKLVNLVFYLIIFAIGFLLGFSAEKINFNKLISQFLFIDNVSASESNEYIGKTITVNSYKSTNSQFFHLVALLETDEDMVIGNVVKTIFKGTNCVNVKNGTGVGATLFSDNTGEVSNSEYVDVISPVMDGHTQTVTGNNIEVSMVDRKFNKTPTTPYIKVPIVLFGDFPFSCNIKELAVIVNGKEKEILKLGSFFEEETFTITDSNNNENENTGGDNTGNDNTGNDNTGDDNTNEDVEIEIVNSGFYEFAQKIFGEVSEENKFIYDFITFGLVATCFTLFVLVVGYIFNNFFGG